MNIVETVLSSGGGSVVKQIAGQFGLTPEQAASAVSSLLPALAGGLKSKLTTDDQSGLPQLISGGSLTNFADDPSSLASPAAIEQGKSLLSQIFGAQDLSAIISKVAEKAGIGADVVTRLLPVGATLLGGMLSQSTAAGGDLTDVVGQISRLGEGGILETVKGLASKMFG
jgi:hypothetical protein